MRRAQVRRARSTLRGSRRQPPTVLLLGETGTGKDLVARILHARSTLAHEAFLALDCTSLPRSLIEAELFGYERGAFTDAKASKRGLLEVADGGTVFLDEIGELDLDVQAKLLRAIEGKKIRRVGRSGDCRIDVRIIAATKPRPSPDWHRRPLPAFDLLYA